MPLHLRNAPTKLMDKLGYGQGYKYAHDYEGHWVEQEFMPAGLEGRRFYEPQTKREVDATAWREALRNGNKR